MLGTATFHPKADYRSGPTLAPALTPRVGRSILRIMPRLYTSFAEFWPFYLREHSKASTRALHYVGTSLVVLIAVAAVVSGRWGWLVALPLAGYFFAWVAHFGVEKNRPATFTYPLWSLAADFKMWAMWLGGRLGPELDRAGVTRENRSD